MTTDYLRDAEIKAPTLDHAAWRDAERDAYADSEDAERFHPPAARALLEHLRTVALDVLTTRQAAALALVCEGDIPPIGPTLAATLAELLAMGLALNSSYGWEPTDFGREVNRVREESTP